MSTPTAKDLLAQADRLMRQRTPEELPVLTDLVIEEIELTSLSDRMDEVIPTNARPSWIPAQTASPSPAKPVVAPTSSVPTMTSAAPPPLPSTSALAQSVSRQTTPAQAAQVPGPLDRSPQLSDMFSGRSRPPQEAQSALATSEGPNTQSAMVSVREKFNEQLLAKMEELQHSVFSQVMQKLELHATGSLKTHLRETLEPALIGIARDLAEQVADDTATQVRQVVSDAVDAEIARLREQFAKKRF
jgi:hypothetical protein